MNANSGEPVSFAAVGESSLRARLVVELADEISETVGKIDKSWSSLWELADSPDSVTDLEPIYDADGVRR